MTTSHPAQTRAAFLALSPGGRSRDVRLPAERLAERGFNTFLIPVFRNGRFLLHWDPARPASRPEGLAVRALNRLLEEPPGSVWLYCDPLSAGPAGSAHPGRFASQHRDWLVRNTSGDLVPLGKGTTQALFSWVGTAYRRHLAAVLAELAQSYPFTGIVLDLRSFPIPANTPSRWFCCNYDSQVRAAEDLGVDFEDMLANGTREEIKRWNQWTLDELTRFIQHLRACVEAARLDISWKLLVPEVAARPRDVTPWLQSFSEGLVDQLLVHPQDPETNFAEVLDALDRTTGHHLPVMPVLEDEDALRQHQQAISIMPCSGFCLMRPDSSSEEKLLDVEARWSHKVALEDEPLDAARALISFVAEKLGGDSRIGKYYQQLSTYMADYSPQPDTLDQILRGVGRVEDKLASGEMQIPHAQQSLIREIGLTRRLLHMVDTPLVMV